jgi:hypothetical protein
VVIKYKKEVAMNSINRTLWLLFLSSSIIRAFPDLHDDSISLEAEETEQAKMTKGGNASDPQFAFDPRGNAFVTWRESTGPQFNIYVERYLAGTGWQQKVLLSNGLFISDPSIAVDAEGNALVIWCEDVGGGVNNVFAARYNVSNGWRIKVNVSNSLGSAYLPIISFDAVGNAMLVWRESLNGIFSVYAARFTVATGWQNKVKIS